MDRTVRIGTRESRLARWQAKYVSDLLESRGFSAEIVLIKSEGDIDLHTPIYEMGIQGVFTKSLDSALLNNRIDIAVHSLKDVPTAIPVGLVLAAVPEREDWRDVLVHGKACIHSHAEMQVIATGSLRRKAQWLNRFPAQRVENLRGNMQTRLDKLNANDWDAAIFAFAGIKRIDLQVGTFDFIDWMLPAPAQGALGIVCRQNDTEVHSACELLNDPDAFVSTHIEREFLKGMNAGCTMPVAGLCRIENGELKFKGNVLSIDGQIKAEIEQVFPHDAYKVAGALAAEALLSNGGREITAEFAKIS